MRVLDRTAMAKKYKGKWVALKNDRKTVVASGKGVASVLRKAQKNGVDMPVITRMPRFPMRFIGVKNIWHKNHGGVHCNHEIRIHNHR